MIWPVYLPSINHYCVPLPLFYFNDTTYDIEMIHPTFIMSLWKLFIVTIGKVMGEEEKK